MTARDIKNSSTHKEVKRIPPPTGEDSIADKESTAFDADGYDKESKRKAHHRGEKLKDILHGFILVGVAIAAILLIFGVLCWAWHVLTPASWHWLTIEQIHEIQKIMSGALLAIVVSDYAKKYF